MMFQTIQTIDSLSEECVFAWEPILDRLIVRAEAAESSLAFYGSDADGRKATGSFYTPADVADHAWRQFFQLHRLDSVSELRSFVDRTKFVEPSAGSGIFVLTFLRKALATGLSPKDLQAIQFSVIDLNYAALSFLSKVLAEIESELDIDLSGIILVQNDFLDWASTTSFERVAFVGNPPFVTNPRGSRWRNLFADFIEAMLNYRCADRSISLILPMSICFSRDYDKLRKIIFASRIGIRAASYDNIPDCLFKSGKPESSNSNKANSQRCTILMLGGPNPDLREAASLRRWTVSERISVLGALPEFHDFSNYTFDGQLPRPICPGVMAYLAGQTASITIGDLVDRTAKPNFAVAAVARNFIGIRDFKEAESSSTPIAARSQTDEMVLLQILASPAFYEYWMTLGDGFHVTRDLVMRFPLSATLMQLCNSNQNTVKAVWNNRSHYARQKLNNGKIVKSYDFRAAFEYIDFR